MMFGCSATFLELADTVLRPGTEVLERAEIDFILAGGLALYARSGMESSKDVDFIVREVDMPQAIDGFRADGWQITTGWNNSRTHEDWLVRAWKDAYWIDLIYCPAGLVVNEQLFQRCSRMEILDHLFPIMNATDLMITRTVAVSPVVVDLSKPLLMARLIREQVDWAVFIEQTQAYPVARAFQTLLESLGILDMNTLHLSIEQGRPERSTVSLAQTLRKRDQEHA